MPGPGLSVGPGRRCIASELDRARRRAGPGLRHGQRRVLRSAPGNGEAGIKARDGGPGSESAGGASHTVFVQLRPPRPPGRDTGHGTVTGSVLLPPGPGPKTQG